MNITKRVVLATGLCLAALAIAHLQAEGRLTNQALAERIALSPSACLARVRRLERAGVIQDYHARLDPFRLDVGLVLFVEVTLKAG